MSVNITRQQTEQIAQVAATMAIENMPITKECYKNGADILSGQKTVDQVVKEIIERYKENAR